MRSILPFTGLVAFCAATVGCDSPIGSRTPAMPIVYVGSPDNTVSGADLYLMSEDGRARDRVTEIGGTMHPHWSPDGRRIAFTRLQALDNSSSIWIVDLATRAVQPITDGSESASMPAWSPDGTRIAYRSAGGITIVDVNGSNRVDIPVIFMREGPVWSVDGTRILYGDRRRVVWAVDLNGENATALTSDEGYFCSPALSPTGDRLAYIRCDFGQTGHKVVVTDLAGSEQEIEIDAFSRVSWAPDGHRLVVDVKRSGTLGVDIILVDLRSGTRTTLTGGPDVVHMGPHWRPH
jgi:Tol biopolymer transport system component